MTRYEQLLDSLQVSPKTWLITGVAGFIGSNLLEVLLGLNQRVVGLDNFATGHQRNLDEVKVPFPLISGLTFLLFKGISKYWKIAIRLAIALTTFYIRQRWDRYHVLLMIRLLPTIRILMVS